MEESLLLKVQSTISILDRIKENEGRTEKGRLLAIAKTHLETAKLFIRETEQM